MVFTRFETLAATRRSYSVRTRVRDSSTGLTQLPTCVGVPKDRGEGWNYVVDCDND